MAALGYPRAEAHGPATHEGDTHMDDSGAGQVVDLMAEIQQRVAEKQAAGL